MSQDSNDSRLLLPVEETAKILGIGRSTTWGLIKTGDLETRHIGRRRLVTMESIRRVASQGANPNPSKVA
tara:strand:- start:169 stop:378 length:210 start_codon:yes stop_codon:yes gene_type:complete